MKQLTALLVMAVILSCCGSNQPKVSKPDVTAKDTLQTAPPAEEIMWKTATYAGQLGDGKNAGYITNTYAIWGSYNRPGVDNTELKVKFLVDRVSFCIKLYEYGQKLVTKGDENFYRISVKSGENAPLEFTAKNVSDRIFINEADAKNVTDLFNKGERITFTLASDSKTAPVTYAFSLDHPKGLGELLGKLSR
jgi:hypothetical protein